MALEYRSQRRSPTEDSQKHETRVEDEDGPSVSNVGLREEAVRRWPSTDGGSGGVTGPVGIVMDVEAEESEDIASDDGSDIASFRRYYVNESMSPFKASTKNAGHAVR